MATNCLIEDGGWTAMRRSPRALLWIGGGLSLILLLAVGWSIDDVKLLAKQAASLPGRMGHALLAHRRWLGLTEVE